METTWIVAADRARARIFERHGNQAALEEVEDMVNPSGRAANRDLNTDRDGRFRAKGDPAQGHTSQPDADASEHEAEQFCRRLSDYLEQAHADHRYDRLYVIAFPKFIGMMRKNLDPQVRLLIEDEIEHDISWFDARQIEDYVRKRLH